MARGFDVDLARRELARADRELAACIGRLGPIGADPRWRKSFDVVDALSRSILYQQLSGKAAATIVSRVENACKSKRLDALALGSVDDASLRACGVSTNKQRALRDLARRAVGGELPSARALSKMESEEVIAALVAVRGIGRWTAEMLLMFRLGRPDVLPVDDLGIRRGIQLLDRLDGSPTAAQVRDRGACWAPWRSMASLYLWRIADGG